ncbi:MAG: 8-oxo-dGTP diphosphatase [Pseudomonadales bacterium]
MWHPNEQPEIETLLQSWHADMIGTLVFMQQGDEVLLIYKKTGHGQGLFNGPGGKLEQGETPLECARRELREELSVTADRLTPMARLRFIDTAGPQWLGYVYCGHGLQGVPTESAEARPQWFPCTDLPLDRMWPDDSIWLPLILQGQSLEGDFLLSGQQLLCYRWRVAAWGREFEHK